MDEPIEPPQPAVRTLDAAGNPVIAPLERSRARRSGLFIGVVAGLVALAGIGGVIAWRVLVGSPFGAAEAVPADADMVMTMDFLQVRDTSRVERFIQAFAAPMADHDIIDEVPDFEAALREFDDEAENELGFRFAEDVFSWIGRSGAIAMWFPEEMFAVDVYAAEVIPSFLATLQVRDEDAARSFLERMVAMAQEEGTVVESITVGGSPGYLIEDVDAPVYVTLQNGRFLLADSLDTLRRGVNTAAGDSIAQTAEFQELSATLGGDPLMTMYISPSLGAQVAALYDEVGLDMPFVDSLAATGIMSTVNLDDDGVVVRAANRPFEGFTVGAGTWGAALPADTFGYIDVTLPEAYLADLADLYLELLFDAGMTPSDVEQMTAPVDDAIGMSLLDDLLPQLGNELMFAVAPATDGAMAVELGEDIGVLFGLGVADGAIVRTAVDNALALLDGSGVNSVERNGLTLIEQDGLDLLALTVTDEAFAASSSPELLGQFVAGTGGLGTSERYRRVDDLIVGEGLAMYVDIAGLVAEYATDDEVRDVLAPLVAAGASYAVEGDFQISEFRLVVDY